MTALELFGPQTLEAPPGHGRWYGAYPATVSDVKDPDSQGRVKVRLPWAPDASGGEYEAWARVATLMAGSSRGTWFVPSTDDEVLVVFEGGDPRRPYVVGALWNGSDAPPESMDGAGENLKRVVKTKNGVKVTLDDQSGQESLKLETPGGCSATLKDGPGSIAIVDSNGNSVKLETGGITIEAASKVTITGSAQVHVQAGSVQVDAGMATFSGVVQCQTLMTNSVISSSYTPGAGNIW